MRPRCGQDGPGGVQDASKEVQEGGKMRQEGAKRRQDAPKMLQDAPRRPKDGPRSPRGRPRTAPRRPQTPQDSSKTAPRGARMRPRGAQIGEKTRHKSDPKRNPSQISFLEPFGADFGRFSDGFGRVLGMILEAWRWIFQGFWEVLRNHRKQHDATGKTACRRRAQRASAASEASGAFRSFGEALRSKTVPRGFRRETKQTGGNQKIKQRFPFNIKSNLC